MTPEEIKIKFQEHLDKQFPDRYEVVVDNAEDTILTSVFEARIAVVNKGMKNGITKTIEICEYMRDELNLMPMASVLSYDHNKEITPAIIAYIQK